MNLRYPARTAKGFNLPKPLLLLGAVAVCFTALAGCSLGSGSTSATEARSLNAYIAPAGTDGSVTLTANGVVVSGATTLAFGQFGNGGSYTNIASGALTASVTGASFATPVVTTSGDTTLTGSGSAYTLAVAGLSGQVGVLAPQVFSIPNFTSSQLVIPTGSAAIRVVDLSTIADNIGLFTSSTAPASALNTTVGTVAYGYSDAANPYSLVTTAQLVSLMLVDVNAPTTALSLAGTTNLNTFAFASGQAYTLYVYGQQGNATQPLTATWVVDFPHP